MKRHIDSVQSIYQAFGRGDIPCVLAALAPQVQWEAFAEQSAQKAGHPLFRARTGPQDVAGFFSELSRHPIHEFQVLDLAASSRQVAAEIVIEYTYVDTGRRLRDEEMHLWTFDEQGRVCRFRHYVDTAKHMRAAGLLPA